MRGETYGRQAITGGQNIEAPELTPEILRDFVHHITVHERSRAYKKQFDTQEIDVCFN